jgi:peptidoglycan/LPS O-acetylase OafA/YrhL
MSYSIYLVHFPVIFALCWAHMGQSNPWPATFDCHAAYSSVGVALADGHRDGHIDGHRDGRPTTGHVDEAAFGARSEVIIAASQAAATAAATATACLREVQDFNAARDMPVWGIPAAALLSLALATALYYFVEEPGRRMLRAPRAKGPKES